MCTCEFVCKYTFFIETRAPNFLMCLLLRKEGCIRKLSLFIEIYHFVGLYATVNIPELMKFDLSGMQNFSLKNKQMEILLDIYVLDHEITSTTASCMAPHDL